MSQALYRKWRPQTWNQVIGQDHIISTLKNALANQREAHAYLFAGPRGTGKTSTARLLAKAVNCTAEDLAARPCNQCPHCQAVNQGHFLDLIEIDAASNTSVEDVRDLRDKINFSPNLGRYKVYIIDEVHMLSTAAFNALLKTLEEPPAHAIFVLATTEVHKIPATVLSRCQRHEFRRIPVPEIVAQLRDLAESEGLQVSGEALTLVARQATGSLRDAISLLDQLAGSASEISLELAHNVLGTVASTAVLELVEAIAAQDLAGGLDGIHQALDSGSDPRQFGRQVVEYLRSVLLVQMGTAGLVDAPREVAQQMAAHARAFEGRQLQAMIKAFNHAASEARLSWQPALPLELAFLEASQAFQAPAEPVTTRQPQARPAAKERRKASAAAGDKPAPAEPVAAESAAKEPAPGNLPANWGQQWDEIKNLVRQHDARTQGLLNSCEPLGIQGGALVLAFKGELVKAKMEQEQHIEIVENVLKQVLERPLRVRCVVASGSGSLPPDVDQDGLVAAVVRDLGGEIVDIQ